MSPHVLRNAFILTGPTGSGKTQLGVKLAELLNAEIISMDSMALYRGMDVGTAKPDEEECRRVRHHLLSVLDPWESSSVAWWLQQAADCCRDIEGRGKKVLFVGGTPLYLKALLYGLFDGPPADEALRQRLTDEAAYLGGAALHRRLGEVDPVTAARLHPNDQRRIIRALEVWELTGRPISDWQQQWAHPPNPERSHDLPPAHISTQILAENEEREPHRGAASPDLPMKNSTRAMGGLRCGWLELPRSELYARIDARVQQMIAAGFVEEVRALRRLPQALSREAAQAVGYKEMFDHLDGRADLEETIQRIQLRSRQLAKRQLTWFRQMPECRPITPELTFFTEGLTINQSVESV